MNKISTILNDEILPNQSLNQDNNVTDNNFKNNGSKIIIQSNEKSKKMRIQEKFKEKISNSTFHALPNIYKTDHFFLKIMWFCLFLIAFALSIILIKKSINDFLDYETVTKIQIGIEQPAEFPTVSFQFSYAYTPVYSLERNIININFQNNLINNLNDTFEQVNSNGGIYYKFNSGRNMNGNITEIKKQKVLGYRGGLTAEVFIGLPNELKTEQRPQYHASYLPIYIHNKSTNAADSTDEPIKLSPGTWTELIIKRVFTNRLGEPYNNCVKDLSNLNLFESKFVHHILIKTNISYRQVDCFDLCMAQNILDKCNISQSLGFVWEINPRDSELDCTRRERENFLNTDIYSKCTPLCPKECDSIDYDIEVMTSKYPTEEYAKVLLNDPKIMKLYSDYNRSITINDLRESMVQLSVYYMSFEYTEISQTVKISLIDSVSNFGGLLGLFIGASFLTFGEFIEIIVELLMILFDKKNFKINVR
jgi:hypothetical protein